MIRLPRSAARLLAIATALLLALPCAADVLRIVVPTGPGGNLDSVARLLGKHLADSLKEPVIVENRPGGDGIIGARSILRAPPDGRTLFYAASSMAAAAVMPQAEFDPQRDFKPVALIVRSDSILAVHPSTGIRTLADLAREAAARPQGLNCAVVAGQIAFGCQLLAQRLNNRVVMIPFQALAPALNALTGGHVDMMTIPRASVPPLAAQGRVVPVAVLGTAHRAPFEQLPLVKDIWPEVRLQTYHGLWVSGSTPADVVVRLNQEINRVLNLPEVRATLAEQGFLVAAGPPEALSGMLAEDIGIYKRFSEPLASAPSSPTGSKPTP